MDFVIQTLMAFLEDLEIDGVYSRDRARLIAELERRRNDRFIEMGAPRGVLILAEPSKSEEQALIQAALDHPTLPDYGDWQYEVANGDTRLGYDDWSAHRLEREASRP